MARFGRQGGELAAHPLLLLGEGRQRQLQIAGQEGLHGIAVEADQLAQELDGQQVLALAALFLDDDLGEDRARDVLVGLGVIDHEVDVLLHHLRQVLERHVGAGSRVVEPAVRVFLDDHAIVVRLSLFACHPIPFLDSAAHGTSLLHCSIADASAFAKQASDP